MKITNHDHEEEFEEPLSPLHLTTYVELSKERAIFMGELFTKEVASSIAALLLHYDNEDPNTDITIYINSNGGDAAALSCIYDVIQMISAPVKTVCIGKCYSAGAVLLCAGAKGKRYIMPHAEVMIHKIQCVFPQLDKTEVDHESYLTFLDHINDGVLGMIAKHTGQKLAKVKADFSSTRNIFLDAQQAIDYGLADHILSQIEYTE